MCLRILSRIWALFEFRSGFGRWFSWGKRLPGVFKGVSGLSDTCMCVCVRASLPHLHASAGR